MKLPRHVKTLAALVLPACALFLTTKAGGLVLSASIEPTARPLCAPAVQGAQAIVVLTGGELRTLEAARLHRETGLPVLASGGDGEAAAIKKHLEDDYQVPVRWTEDKSLTTEQNALFSAQILAGDHVRRVILVTQALHMRRARTMFQDRGLEVIPAPTDFYSTAPLQWRDFLPSLEGRQLTTSALHEIFGLAWYRLR